ncbi:3-hydroxyisobutyryl-CoA hydrolase 1-like isoform X1 [Camellia sinensis]|uniref:3-hydroxyisobutyryl-CoA hydrolase 1-like isoform X1 n=1 Tax=Camellia sinensis TaxID=4442 RepID=UPI001036EA27|nr:3-hydroxyisobutyryl-CoA hydrolase 1-like isoform X1 [Camellia sinensis]
MEPINYSNGDADQVLLEDYSYGIKVLLNRPKQLNALSFQMVSRLLELFLASEEDCNVKLIILKGKGRAFSAGGDVAAVVRDIKGNWKLGAKFFQKEFILNYVMATYSKPQVSILNGIVMGGGAGASIHGRFRVATENSVFAMPETALGLFPDVGASYFLSRLPGFFGEYVGLTGSRLDGAEMLACGLATHFVSSVRLSLLEEALCKVNSSDPDIISATIHEFSQQPSLKEKSSYNRLDIINKCFSRRTVEEIIFALEREAVNSTDNWISSTIKSLKTASPTSLKISLRSIREGRVQGVGQCLVREYRIVCNIMDGQVSKDFFEGCRAILLDKDKNPKWEPSKLVLVSDEMVDRYFSKVDDKDWEDLKLPVRSNLPGHAIAKL